MQTAQAKPCHQTIPQLTNMMKSRKSFPILMSLMLGALLVTAWPAGAQPINVTPSALTSWEGSFNVYNATETMYIETAAMDLIDLRAYFYPNAANPTLLVMKINTNTYDVTATNYWSHNQTLYFNTAGGGVSKSMHPNLQVNIPTNNFDIGKTVTFSGSWVSNTIPAAWKVYAFITEFTMPGYGYVGESDSLQLTAASGTFSVSRPIAAGNLAQYGLQIRGGNTAPNSANANYGIAFVVTNPPTANPATNVLVDPAAFWQGFLNYYFASNNPYADNYDAGTSIAITDIPAEWSPDQATATKLILRPNTACYDASSVSPYAISGAPNFFNNPNSSALRRPKPTYFVDNTSLYSDTPLTFSGVVESNTLPAGYTAYAYIEDFLPDGFYVFNGESRVALPKSGPFSVSRRIGPGNTSQYGFYVYGTALPPASPLASAFVSILVPNTQPPVPVTVSIEKSGNFIHILFPTESGKTYTVQYKVNITDANWTTLGTPSAGTGGTVTVNDGISLAGRRYYRISVQ